MLLKFFGSRNHNAHENANSDPNPNPNPKLNFGEKPLIVKIIHPGGVVERYYMAFPAAWIIEKYPKFVLTRPEIFQRPWDSVVRPEEILVPGQKYFVVPIRTVKKLRRRMMKSTNDDTGSSEPPAAGKGKAVNRRVRFKGIEAKTRQESAGGGGGEDNGMKKKKKKSLNGKGLRKKNVRFSPSLTIIDGLDE